MGKILWTERANNDLKAIFDFIAIDSIFYAERFIKSLIHSTSKLENFPLSGRIIPEFEQQELREIIFKDYRIVYRISEMQDIKILSVIHANRDFINVVDKT